MSVNLKTKVSKMQHNLIVLVEAKQSLTDLDVLKVSQDLDQMIIQLQQLKLLTRKSD